MSLARTAASRILLLRRSFIVLAAVGATPLTHADSPSFNRDVRPILSEYCYACHGPDKNQRKADLRLDQAESALADHDGVRAFAPGKIADSDAITRILSTDPDECMPPPKTKKKIKPDEIEVLKRWIEQGAKYEPHWAFTPPRKPPVPHPDTTGSPHFAVRNPIDAFILERLQRNHLSPSPEAEKSTLIRRVTYDLTGLPPTPTEIAAFLGDKTPDAYERLVDRLLASPRYGEKQAVHWLDLSRYADTHGYHLDAGRNMWLWRDWVIDAFNRNVRFDEFTRLQLAGDLLPNATPQQKLPTGFVRNNMINFEGGAIAAEYLNAYIVDRVNTVGTVFLGLTVNCCQCHDHKYDPITQREFYQLYAYFNAVPENGLDGSKGNAAPVLQLASPDQEKEIARLQSELNSAATAYADRKASANTAQPAWEQKVDLAIIPKPVADALRVAVKSRSPQQVDSIKKFYRDQIPELKAASDRVESLKQQLASAQGNLPNVMVMAQSDKPRPTNIRIRGDYATLGDSVEPGIPAALGSLPPNAPNDRRALAAWLTDPANPLVARVTVNRFWHNYFGTGLVKTVNDFGLQGEWPSHPELLDWLAVEFIERGWNVKDFVRLLVTSSTYRQSAAVSPAVLTADPENRLYARGPRFRLSAEEIRDTALATSGLLDSRIGGPSVYPYQPDGIWEELSSRQDSKNWTAQFFVQSHGPDLYRRSLYTFWKRTCPPPQMQTFDAPDRETCTAQRERTNTPLQALITLNDPTYVEASRKFAERIMHEGGDSVEARIAFAFQLATARKPTPAEIAAITNLLERQKRHYSTLPDQAARLLSVGEAPRDERLNSIELAAWTIVANTILNLDESLTRG